MTFGWWGPLMQGVWWILCGEQMFPGHIQYALQRHHWQHVRPIHCHIGLIGTTGVILEASSMPVCIFFASFSQFKRL